MFQKAESVLSPDLDSNPNPTDRFFKEYIASLFCVTLCIVTNDTYTPRMEQHIQM
jgi:hypothetical protein